MIDQQKPIEATLDGTEQSETPTPSSPEVAQTDASANMISEDVSTSATTDVNAPVGETGEFQEEKGDVQANPEQNTPEQVIAVLTQEVETLQQALNEQTQQADVLKNRYISLAAEFDNFRKRTLREKEELEKQVKCRTLSELLSVVDNFERARVQLKPDNDGEMAIHRSYQSVYKNLVDSLKRLGVSAMRPEGEPFDPAYHEAMLREPTNEHPEGTVIEQLVRGYLLEDQVLRHAMVKVAAPKTDESTAEETTPASDPEQMAPESP